MSRRHIFRPNLHSLGIAQERLPHHDAACASIILVVQHVIPGAYIAIADDRDVDAFYEGFHHGEVRCALPSPAGRWVTCVQGDESRA